EPNSKQKAMYDKMSNLSGDSFDREFAKEMMAVHKKDIKEFERQQRRTTQPAPFQGDAADVAETFADRAVAERQHHDGEALSPRRRLPARGKPESLPRERQPGTPPRFSCPIDARFQ